MAIPKKILIVDDQFGIRVLLSEVFNRDDFITFQAANGVQALKIMTEEEPDLILLDMKMPGMDGLEILRKMREESIQIDVIMMTAYGELELLTEAKELGASRYFAKPFEIDYILNEVTNYLHNDTKISDF